MHFSVIGQSDTLEIELNWSNKNIKYITGRVTVSDSSINLYYGKLFKGEDERNTQITLKVPISVNKEVNNCKIEVSLDQFYNEKIYIFASNNLEKVVFFLNEYPFCELKRIEKQNKKR
ncbi:hypothetical protein [Brumimicrobium aurantiacum]|uniref:Uncharacterized protein n=1 Tax=Brumimicrobium aurantiacum TaxID=1737063 RepID=A0A3E1EZH2_9FLAO|nr:hypothetical protein [Brumimicrobium aurantiacum]RFC54972.1 hypothetical protein DXU93_03890 [Brumimicrobium aurantiacum]